MVEALDRQHRGEGEQPSTLANHLPVSGAIGETPGDLSGLKARPSTGQDKPSESLPRAREFGAVQSTVVAIAPIASPLAASRSFGFASEATMALLLSVILFSAALVFVLSAALAAGRTSPNSDSAGHALQAGRRDVSRAAQLLAEQLRCDVGEMAHAMRSPIAVITAYAERLKSVVPANDVRAQRAIEAVGLSSAQLNRLLDGAWQRGDELASLFLAERYPVDLAAILHDVAAEDSEMVQPGRIAMGDIRAGKVAAPPGIMERIVDELLETLLGNSPCARVVATVGAENGLICLHLALEEEPPADANSVEMPSTPEELPLLASADRTVSMLGGTLTTITGEGGVRSVTVALPESDV
jgi:hypothetical protein